MTEPSVHRPEDLHAAALVWLSRRKQITAMLTRENPHLSATDIHSLVSGCCLYTTCQDDFFQSVYATRTAADEVVA